MSSEPQTLVQQTMDDCSRNWKDMTRWQQASFIINYVAVVCIIITALYPGFVHQKVSGIFKRNVNPMYVICLLAILIFISNTSFVVSYTDLF